SAFLILSAKEDQDFHVAHVRSLAVKDVVTQRAAAQFFADKGIFDQGQPQPAIVGRQKGGPQPCGLDLGALGGQLGDKVGKVALEEVRFQREKLLLDKLAHLGDERLDAGGWREVHKVSSFSGCPVV